MLPVVLSRPSRRGVSRNTEVEVVSSLRTCGRPSRRGVSRNRRSKRAIAETLTCRPSRRGVSRNSVKAMPKDDDEQMSPLA